MDNILLFALLGLASGGIYASLGLGLIVTFRTAAVVNFAEAAMFLIGAVQYQDIRATGELRVPIPGVPIITLTDGDPGFWVAASIAVVVTAGIGVLQHVVVFRKLRDAPELVRVVASIGIMLTLQALYILRYGPTVRRAEAFLPGGTTSVFGVAVPKMQLFVAGIVIVLSVLLGLVYQRSRFGREASAVAAGGIVTTVLGVPRERVATLSWAVAGALAGVMGILFSTVVGVDPSTYPLFVVPALGAALIGRFKSFFWTVLGGFAIGVGQSLIGYAQTKPWMPDWMETGLKEGLPFLIVIVVLWRLGQPIAQRGTVVVSKLPRVPEMPRSIGGAPVLLVLGSVAIVMSGAVLRLALVQAMITAVLVLSMVVLTGFVGQVSLAQAVFAGMGGFTVAILAGRLGVPVALAQLGAVAAAAAVGLLVALPALRIRGTQLAVVTLAAAVAIEQFVFRNAHFTGGRDGIAVPELSYGPIHISAGSGKGFPSVGYSLFVLVNLTVIYVGVRMLRRSMLGKRLLSIRANERGAGASAIDPRRIKLLAFTLSAAIAGWSGVLTAHLRGQLSFESFGVFVSIGVLGVAYIGGISRPAGAIIAGLISSAGPVNHVVDEYIGLGRWVDLVSGLALVFMAVAHPEGLAADFAKLGVWINRNVRRHRQRPQTDAATPSTAVRKELTSAVGSVR